MSKVLMIRLHCQGHNCLTPGNHDPSNDASVFSRSYRTVLATTAI